MINLFLLFFMGLEISLNACKISFDRHLQFKTYDKLSNKAKRAIVKLTDLKKIILNLTTKYKSPLGLYENFIVTIKEQSLVFNNTWPEALRIYYFELLSKKPKSPVLGHNVRVKDLTYEEFVGVFLDAHWREQFKRNFNIFNNLEQIGNFEKTMPMAKRRIIEHWIGVLVIYIIEN